jgi:hypothetical protein
MASPFDALMANVDAACDAIFGEAVTIAPQATGNYSVRSDPERPPAIVTAIVSISPQAGDVRGQMTSEGVNQGRTTNVAPSTIWISAAAAAALGYDLKAGDLIELSSRAGTPVYRMERPAVTDLGDLEAVVTLHRGRNP